MEALVTKAKAGAVAINNFPLYSVDKSGMPDAYFNFFLQAPTKPLFAPRARGAQQPPA